jgi:asparagine synthase (glutamine-hydrolysing)
LGYLFSNDPDAAARVSNPADLQRRAWQRGAGPINRANQVIHWGHDCFARHLRAPGQWQLLFEGYLDREHAALSADTLIDPASFEADPVDRLRGLAGAYTLVAWNTETGEIIATRDRTGARTVYFTEHRGFLTLATSSDWVVRASGRTRREEPRFIVSLFALQQAPPPGLSAFEGVRELMPGEVLRYRDGKLTINHTPRDFEALVRAGQRKRRADDWADEFFHLLNNAVISCLPPEGEVACMLSGGLDSGPTAVLADAALHALGRKLRAVSWSLKDFPGCDETHWIQLAAERLHHPVDFRDMSHALPFSRLDESVIVPDLPIYNGFRLLVNDCYERAAGLGCRVVLNASTGDEIYPQRRWVHLDRWRRRQWRLLSRDLHSVGRTEGLGGLGQDPAVRYPVARALVPWRYRPSAPEWLAPEARSHWCPPSDWPPDSNDTPWPEFSRQLFGAPMAFGVAQEAPMAQRLGIDRRDPFQNEALLEFMLGAPFDLSWRNGASKAVMRRAMRRDLPNAFLAKARTGRLETFFEAGLQTRRESLLNLCSAGGDHVETYVRAGSINPLLDKGNEGPAALLSATVGYGVWRQRLFNEGPTTS